MKKIFKTFVFLYAFLLVFLLVLTLQKSKLTTARVCFQEHCFSVKIAMTPLQQQRGLMWRNYLSKDEGMLFVFKKEGDYPFWMKNTLIPLDIIWMNQNQEVVFIKESAQPCRETCGLIDPHQNAQYVLEVNSRVVKDIHLNVGDSMSF